MTRDEWIADFADRVGAGPPSSEEVEAILDLAAIAAHASERTAAPIACWVAGRTQRGLDEMREAGRAVGPG
jgi:uncharacterized protein DUF6457